MKRPADLPAFASFLQERGGSRVEGRALSISSRASCELDRLPVRKVVPCWCEETTATKEAFPLLGNAACQAVC